MFQFGLFSTHLPYIITVVAYLLSYGFYAFDSSGQAPEPDQKVDSYVVATSLSPSYSADLSGSFVLGASSASYCCEPVPVNGVKPPCFRACISLFYPPNERLVARKAFFHLFSRPPTVC